MSWQSLADVFEYVQRTDDLTSSEVLVLLALANFTNQHGTNAYPSLVTLQNLTKLSRRTLQYTLRKLESRRLITCETHRGAKGYTTYTLRLPHVQFKGATIAPLSPSKGAMVAPLKVQPLHPDPVQRSHVPPETLKAILASLEVPPDSNIYQWTLNAAGDPHSNGDHG